MCFPSSKNDMSIESESADECFMQKESKRDLELSDKATKFERKFEKVSASSAKSNEKNGKRRPDKPLYVPKAQRHVTGVSTENSCKTKVKNKAVKKVSCELSAAPFLKFYHEDSSKDEPPNVEGNPDYRVCCNQFSDSHFNLSKNGEKNKSEKSADYQKYCSNALKKDDNCNETVKICPIDDSVRNISKFSDVSTLPCVNSTVSHEPLKETVTASLSNERNIRFFDGTEKDFICSSRKCTPVVHSPNNVEDYCDKKTNTSAYVLQPNVVVTNLSRNNQANTEVDSWDVLFDDDGECLCPEAVRELTSVIGSLEVKCPKNRYFEFKNDDEYNSDFEENFTGIEEQAGLGNIVELYGFPVDFNTQDLVSALSCFKSEYYIRWVDDCHALAVFSSVSAASQAAELDHPLVKVRPVSQGAKASRLKAKSCTRSMPIKPRPATSAALARRLVSGALGLKVSVPKEERERERKIISDAKEQRKKVAKQRENIWDGVLT